MRMWVKLTLTALATSALLSAAIGSASARSLSVSNQSFRVTWARLEFVSIVTVRCPVTLEGSFHSRTVTKTARTLIGLITRAVFNQAACEGGTFSAFNGTERYNGGVPANTLPWHLTYESFTGRLPNIASIRLLLARFRLGLEAVGCAVQIGNETDNFTGEATREAGGALTTLTPVEGRNEATIIRTDRDFLGACPRPGSRLRFRGVGNVTLLGSSTTRITVTLI